MSSNQFQFDLATIRETLIQDFGKPKEILSFRHDGESIGVPSEIEVLCFEPDDSDAAEKDWFTYLVTCGLATHSLAGAIDRFELLFSVRRRLQLEERHQLGRRVAELGTIPFRDHASLEPEMILTSVTLPLFERMDHVVFSLYRGGEYLPTQPPIAIIHVSPVFQSEAEQIRVLGVHEAFYRFSLAGINRDDPTRPEVDLMKVETPMTEPKHSKGSESVDELWEKIESQSKSTAGLHGPAEETSIRTLLDWVADDIPEDFVQSLRRHDGADDLNGYELFSAKKLLEIREDLLTKLRSGSFKDRAPDGKILAQDVIEPDWWNAGWIPFAAKGPETTLFMDQFPAKNGSVGQILEWNENRGPVRVTHNSFASWLKDQLKQLK